VDQEIVNSFLTFPTRDEFLRYFRSTQLYEETAEKRGMTMEQMVAAMPQEKDVILSKEMVAVVATK